MNVTLTVDGKPVTVPEQSTVLDAVRRLGVYIPQLCKDPGSAGAGSVQNVPGSSRRNARHACILLHTRTAGHGCPHR